MPVGASLPTLTTGVLPTVSRMLANLAMRRTRREGYYILRRSGLARAIPVLQLAGTPRARHLRQSFASPDHPPRVHPAYPADPAFPASRLGGRGGRDDPGGGAAVRQRGEPRPADRAAGAASLRHP